MIPPPPRPTLFPYTTLFRSTAAGTSKTVVYRHFADRTELHVAVCSRVAASLTARLREAMESTGEPRQMVAAAVETYLRSEEHTSELQSQSNLVCRLLLEKKK